MFMKYRMTFICILLIAVFASHAIAVVHLQAPTEVAKGDASVVIAKAAKPSPWMGFMWQGKKDLVPAEGSPKGRAARLMLAVAVDKAGEKSRVLTLRKGAVEYSKAHIVSCRE